MQTSSHIVLNVSSCSDYQVEKPYFLTGGARWLSTKDKKEKVGDKFGFVNFRKKIVEVFNIDDIKTSDESHMWRRDDWGFVRQGNLHSRFEDRGILILSPKLGELSYVYLCENTKTKNGTGCEYNPFHPLRGITRRTWNDKVDMQVGKKGLGEVKERVCGWERNRNRARIRVKDEGCEDVEGCEDGEGYLYFIREETPYSEDLYFTKVGFSNNPERRLCTHQCGNPRKLILVNVIKCLEYKKAEKYMHRYFSDRRTVLGGGTEWFVLREVEINQICDNCVEK
jgi:hypothetical protein